MSAENLTLSASPAEQAAALLALRARGVAASSFRGRQLKFRAWAEQYVPRYQWYPWVAALAPVIDRLAADELEYDVIVGSAPPRTGKSEFWSRLAPPYYLYRHADRVVGVASVSAKLADGFSRWTRARYALSGAATRSGATLRSDKDLSRAVNNWETTDGGGMWSCGMGGTQVGFGYHLGITDDLIGSPEEAHSLTNQQKIREWLDSVWLQRREPVYRGGVLQRLGIVVSMMTRWGWNDSTGALLELARDRGWKVLAIHLPAFAEEREAVEQVYADYPNVEIWRDPRPVGAPLCPERQPAEELRKLQRGMIPYNWDTLFQQRPSVRGGAMFVRDKWNYLPELPAADPLIRVARGWDKAGSEGGSGAQTAGVKVGILRSGRVVILDAVTDRLEAYAREQLIDRTAAADGRKTIHVIEQEPGSGGKDSAQQTLRRLGAAGYKAAIERPTADKTLRAEGFAAAQQAGNVYLVGHGSWIPKYIDEAERFPTGKLRDRIDATTLAYNFLTLRARTVRPAAPVSGPRYPAYAVS